MSKIESLLLCAFVSIFVALVADSLVPGSAFWLLQPTMTTVVLL